MKTLRVLVAFGYALLLIGLIGSLSNAKAEEVITEDQFCYFAAESLNNKEVENDYRDFCLSLDGKHQNDLFLVDFLYVLATTENK